MDVTINEVQQHSMNSVQSPLKAPLSSAAKMGGSVHTLCVDEENDKGDYELARDRRVAALQEILRPVQTAAAAL